MLVNQYFQFGLMLIVLNILFPEALRREKFLTDLLNGVLSSLTSPPPLAAQSPTALLEEDYYSALKAHQDVSHTTRVLEDELIALQRKIENIDKLTAEERKEISLRLEKKKLQLSAAISRTAKILRAAYNIAYPERGDKPIIIVPKDISDDETEKAFKMLKEGESDLRAHRSTKCAAVADAFLWIQKQHSSSKDEFKEQTDILARLPLKDRVAFDKEKISYWKQKAKDIEKTVLPTRGNLA